MNDHKVILETAEVSESLLSYLESRQVALWVQDIPNEVTEDEFAEFLSLPWHLVISEISNKHLLDKVDVRSNNDPVMTRKRGYVQIIDSDPSRIELPQRCLPFYLLNGPEGSESSKHEAHLRQLTMLEELRRSGVRQVLIVSAETNPIPPLLRELWSSGFRSYLTVITDVPNSRKHLDAWVDEVEGKVTVTLFSVGSAEAVRDVLSRFLTSYPEDRQVIRIRDRKGSLNSLDITDLDDPERPLLEFYDLVEDRDLVPLVEEELEEAEFIAFFQSAQTSWRPYAAGLPWMRDDESINVMQECLARLDIEGSQENCIAFIRSESGAGGSTLAQALGWHFAKNGYPVLAAKPTPFVPDALTIGNFLTRVHAAHQDILEQHVGNGMESGEEGLGPRYETPWVIIFDRLHWEEKDGELRRFVNSLQQQGRPVCILIVAGPMLPLTFYESSLFVEVAELNHALDQEEARDLGRHLNRFLRGYGKERQTWQWDQFYESHTIRHLEGMAAFWVTLSFWIQGQYDLSESIQEWMYRKFNEQIEGELLRQAIFEIAAMSSERVPLPESLLPAEEGSWPVSALLEDERPNLGALGLARISADSHKYWALAHDILGRFLINALFYDFQSRDAYGFADAESPDHLRFMLLRQVAHKKEIGEVEHRAVGEEFATSIFKIDPDHGRGSFAKWWREVLLALDKMPRSLRDTSRVFRHHSAVTRRRIAKLDESFFGVTPQDRIELLNRAIDDIKYSLTSIEYTPGSEPNLNLYNSLANAYLDLAEVEASMNASRERLQELRELANDATRRAYEESPNNSFTIETYVKNRLNNAEEVPEEAIAHCLEALGVLYSAIASGDSNYRRSQLAELADRALNILMKQIPTVENKGEPHTATEVLLNAWACLADGVDRYSGDALSEIPEANRLQAIEALDHPAGRGNMQVLRLTYDLLCVTWPMNFTKQLELVEQLQATDYRLTPQLRLEYGLLLYQNERAVEGDKVFRALRKLWRESEHFVHVPERLRWLRDQHGGLKAVQASTGSDYGHRAFARVREFSQLSVPFRPEEFGFHDLRPGVRFRCHVSFGHNGPFLRPVTAGTKASQR